MLDHWSELGETDHPRHQVGKYTHKPLIVVPMRLRPGRFITNYFMQRHQEHYFSASTVQNMLFICASWDHSRNLRNIWLNLKWDGNIFPVVLWSLMFCETIAGSSFEHGKISMERKMLLFAPRHCFRSVLQDGGDQYTLSRNECYFVVRRVLDQDYIWYVFYVCYILYNYIMISHRIISNIVIILEP